MLITEREEENHFFPEEKLNSLGEDNKTEVGGLLITEITDLPRI